MNTMILSRLILVSTFLFSFSHAFSQCVEEFSIHYFSSSTSDYILVKQNKTWAEAADCAKDKRNGKLARIDSQEENDFIFSEVAKLDLDKSKTVAPDGGGASYIWLGGSDLTTEGKWIWDVDGDGSGDQFWEGKSDGSAVGGLYNNWGSEPDDFGGKQDALAFAITDWPLGKAGQWNDVNELNELYFLIEIEKQTGLNEMLLNDKLMIYPNPAIQQLQIDLGELSDKIEVLKVFDVMGKENQIEINLENQIAVLKTSNLAKGTYILHLKLESGAFINRYFIKN